MELTPEQRELARAIADFAFAEAERRGIQLPAVMTDPVEKRLIVLLNDMPASLAYDLLKDMPEARS